MTDKDPQIIKSVEGTMADGIRQALSEEMRRDERVFLMGEDIAIYGGGFKTTRGMINEFGPNKIIDTPLAESAIVGLGIGAAWNGMRPVVEIMFADLLTLPFDQIVNNAAKWHYLSNGQDKIPLVIRTSHGGGTGFGAMHSQSAEAWFANIPGIKLVMPSNPADAKGLLKASIRDDNPVIFFEHKALYFVKGPIPEGENIIPLGKASIKNEGSDVTIVAWGMMVLRALEAAKLLAEEGVSAEVIDLRTIVPLDKETILESVRKTGKLVTVEEAPKTGGFGGEIAALAVEEAIDYLEGPVVRVAGLDTPIPEAKVMEAVYFPNAKRIVAAVHKAMGLEAELTDAQGIGA
ncbi:MAG: alpha-ketoacid dehydrogenase subunit beta [Chloroflexi bacterium]|nr:alpha-ketoacid dehydrogenase subunit beta [Chloroflexota bacterium]